MLATDSTAASVAIELADRGRFVKSLPTEFGGVCDSPRGASGGGVAAITAGVSDVAASRASGDGTSSGEGAGAAGCSVACWVGNAAVDGSAGAVVATAAGTPVGAGVASADAVVSLLDGVELVCAPPELCTIPERGSAVEASVGEEVELAWASTELCTFPEVEPDEEPAAEADEVDEVRSDSDDELESGDELEEPESVGWANATPGVFATAAPKPSATANMPTRPTYCAFTGIPLFLAVRPCGGQPVPFVFWFAEPGIAISVGIIAVTSCALLLLWQISFSVDRDDSGNTLDTCTDPLTSDLELVS